MIKSILTSRHSTNRASYKSYITGFLLSIVLTIIPFIIAANKLIWGWALVVTLFGFALSQVFVQLKFFIHLGYDPKPRWNRLAFVFMTLVLIIVVAGTLWIMKNLDYNMVHHESGHQLPKNEGF